VSFFSLSFPISYQPSANKKTPRQSLTQALISANVRNYIRSALAVVGVEGTRLPPP